MTFSNKHALTLGLVALVAFSAQAVAGVDGPASLELRSEAAMIGSSVSLRHIARWSAADAAYFRELADVTVARFEPGQRELKLDLAAIRTVLEGAGVAGSDVIFRGPMRVTITRLDAQADHAQRPAPAAPTSLDDFLNKTGTPASPAASASSVVLAAPGANQPMGVSSIAEQALPFAATTQAPVALPTVPAEVPFAMISTVPSTRDVVGTYTLRMALVADLSQRLGINAEDIELSFPSEQDRVLNLTEPTYSWKITSLPNSNKLGNAAFRVTVSSNGQSRTLELKGNSRVWQEQVKCVRPIASGQILRAEDFEARRVLCEKLAEEAPIHAEHLLTMQAVRQISPGVTLSMRLLKPVLLVQTGQLVTVNVREGGISVRAVGKAKTSGAYGQAIDVMVGEGRNNVLTVTVTGPQEGTTGTLADAKATASASLN